MIDIVSGQVAAVDKASVVVMVGGIGLRINVPKTVFDVVTGPGHLVTLYTHLVVREDALTLFGFVTEEDRRLFEVLLTVSGVGKKTAEKIVFELKGKLGMSVALGLSPINDTDGDLIAALTNLGYSIVEAQTA